MPGRLARRTALLASGLVLAACMARPETPLPDGLAGTSWRAETLVGEPVADDTVVTMEFAGSDRIAGKAACNRYNGPLRVEAGRLRIGPLATTRMACPPPLMAAEEVFLAALEGPTRLSRDNSALLLHGAAGTPPSRFVPFTPP